MATVKITWSWPVKLVASVTYHGGGEALADYGVIGDGENGPGGGCRRGCWCFPRHRCPDHSWVEGSLLAGIFIRGSGDEFDRCTGLHHVALGKGVGVEGVGVLDRLALSRVDRSPPRERQGTSITLILTVAWACQPSRAGDGEEVVEDGALALSEVVRHQH